MSRPRGSAFLGVFLLGAILVLGAVLIGVPQSVFPDTGYVFRDVYAGTTATATAIIGNATPSVTALTLNNASSIILIANATKTVTVSFTISDNNGCSDVFTSGVVTTTVFRSGVSSTCAVSNPGVNANYLNCYVQTTTTYSCVGTSTSANATTSFDIYYFAEATDASSSFSAQTWQAYVSARDGSSTNATTSAGVELLTLTGLNVETSSINYGTVNPGADTGSTNQTAQVKNAGNSSTTLSLNGTAMTSGGNSIATTSQHYATTTFTYGGSEQQLQGAATAVTGFSIPRPPLATWATTAPYPNVTADNTTLIENGFIYVIGGWDDDAASNTSTVLYAPIGATGTLGSWATTTPFPHAIQNPAAVSVNDIIYVVGGWDGGSLVTSTVRYAAIGSTGTLGAWATTTPYPNTIYDHSIFEANGNIYIVGGIGNGSWTSTVRFAPIGATGTLGSWATTTAYPNIIGDGAVVRSGDFVYMVGGRVFPPNTSTVRYAAIGSTGTLGAWIATAALPTGTAYFPAFGSGEFIYAVGGFTTSNPTSTVLYATISASGSLGSWSPTLSYPVNISNQSLAVSNGLVYVIAGFVGGGAYTSTVLYASLASRNTYWGFATPTGTAAGTYSGQNTFTAVFQP